MNKVEHLKTQIESSIQLKQAVLSDADLLATVAEVAELCIATFQRDGKVLFCGNGGSAADAQHLSGELSGRYYFDREPLFSEALHVNTSFLTATANDYDFTEVYARMVRAMGREGDVLFALSTSGNSPNIIRAAEDARRQKMSVVAMTGATGGALQQYADYVIRIPSRDTPRIQEIHMLIGHIICEQIESAIFEKA